MPLKINVKSGEKFIVNGAVMVAGNKGASLVLQNEATILLGKDVMQESEANTPSRRIYFSILVMYLDRKMFYLKPFYTRQLRPSTYSSDTLVLLILSISSSYLMRALQVFIAL